MRYLERISFTLIAIIFASSCEHEEATQPEGVITFSFSQLSANGDRVSEELAPAFVWLNVEDAKGHAQQSKLMLLPFGQGFISEALKLQTGKYQLTQFLVLDADNKTIYAAPLKGSDMAQYVTEPLPMEFSVLEEGVKVIPQVLAVSDDYDPEDFGYASFGFDIINIAKVKILVDAEVLIGTVLYENIDATIRVTGFDAENNVLWSQNYFFIGPEVNTIEIKKDFHHYSIEMVDKWGINDKQSDISAQDIFSHRADGPSPITYTLAGTKKAKNLSQEIHYREFNEGSEIIYQPTSRSLYTYDGSGRLENIRHQVYNSQTLQFDESSNDAFTYEPVLKINTTFLGNPSIEEIHEPGKITQTLFNNNGLVWTLTYINNGGHVVANYSLSNGNSFSYKFEDHFKNKVADEVSKQGELCSQATYTYDKYINPFRHLGYTDFNFLNWSANNIVKEDHQYKACGFPVITPVSHEYYYDLDGYPSRKITTYAGASFEGNHPCDQGCHEKVEFYYHD